MGTSIISQIIAQGWDWSHIGILMSTTGCIVIGSVSLGTKNYSLKSKDWIFLLISVLCLALYLISENPWLTTIYAILADFIIAIPTLINAVKDPESEKTHGWTMSLISWTLTLSISFHHHMLYALFPIYLFAYSLGMVFIVRKPFRKFF